MNKVDVAGATEGTKPLPGLNQESFEFLMQSSQNLWRESSFERLLVSFTGLLQTHLGLSAASFMNLRVQDRKITWEKSILDLKGIEPLGEASISGLEKNLLSLDLKSQEYRQGSNSIHSAGKDISFAILGDPASDWSILLWQPQAQPSFDQQQNQLLQDFLVRQLQSATLWFGRLDKTQALLYKDDLTGLFNIRYLDVALESEIRRVQRFQTCFSLLFIDLDNFKQVNDQYGHLAGSTVLKQVADVLRSASREVDSVMRFGGDEFVIILLGANSSTGLLAAERIRKKIEKSDFRIEGGATVNVTASIGVATCPEHASEKAELLNLADASLYEGKRGGKNKVAIVDPRKLLKLEKTAAAE